MVNEMKIPKENMNIISSALLKSLEVRAVDSAARAEGHGMSPTAKPMASVFQGFSVFPLDVCGLVRWSAQEQWEEWIAGERPGRWALT